MKVFLFFYCFIKTLQRYLKKTSFFALLLMIDCVLVFEPQVSFLRRNISGDISEDNMFPAQTDGRDRPEKLSLKYICMYKCTVSVLQMEKRKIHDIRLSLLLC